MQAFARTSMQVRGNDRISPQQSPSSLQPAWTSQSGYYSGQHTMLNAHNTAHPYGNSYVPSFQSNSSSSHFQSSSSSRNDLPGPQQTFSSQMSAPSSQPGYHSLQQQMQFSNQMSPGVRNGQFSYSSSQPKSDFAQPNSQPSQGQFCGSLSRMQYRPSGSSKAPYPNVTAHVQQIPNNHQKVPSVNLNYFTQSSNAPFQDYKNMPHSQNGQVMYTSTSFPSVPSSGVPALETNQNHVSVPLRYQTQNGMQTMPQPAPQPQQMATNANQTVPIININQGQMASVRNGASYGSTAQLPTVAQVPTAPSAPPTYTDHILVNQGQFPNNTESMARSLWLQNMLRKLYRLFQSKSQQHMSQSSSPSSLVNNPPPQGFNSVSQGVQSSQAPQPCNTVPFSDRPNKISLPLFPDNQYNVEPQGPQANRTMDLLTADSQKTVSCTPPSGEAPLPAHSGNVDYSKVTLLDLLLEQKDDHPVSTSLSGQQRTIRSPAGHPECTQAQAPPTAGLHYAVPPNPDEREVLKVSLSKTMGKSFVPVNAGEHGSQAEAATLEGAEFNRLNVNSATGKSDQKTRRKRHREVELCTNPADCLELVAALQKAVRQVHRAVAVVPPISLQADSGKKKKDDSEEIESKQSETNATSPPKETSEELLRTQNSIKPVNESPVSTGNNEEPLTGNPTATDSQNVDSAQTENRPIPKSQSPNLVQAPISSTDLTAKSPQQQPDDRNVSSYSDDAMFDFSTLPVLDCTLNQLQQYIMWLSPNSIDKEKEKQLGTDVSKRIVDLYWGGDINNLAKAVKLGQWASSVQKLSVRNKQDVVFQHVESENLKKLACHYIMEEHEPILPAKKFKSSWLNVEEIPPDIDKVLAEPVSDYAFTWCTDFSVSMSDGTVLPVDSLDQGNAAEGLVVSTQNISDSSAVNPPQGVDQVVSPEEKISEVTSDDTAVSPQDSLVQGSRNDVADQVESIKKQLSNTTSIYPTEGPIFKKESSKITSENFGQNASSGLFSSFQIPILELELNDVTEPGKLIENKQTPTEMPAPASHLSNSDPPVERDGNSNEKANLSSADSSSDDLSMDVELLSTDAATAIFKVQEEPPELFPEEVFVTISNLANSFDTTELRPSRPPKFTCPHVTDTMHDGDHFCSKCLAETPLLDVDLDDSLLSPNEDGPNVSSSPLTIDSGSCSPNSGSQTETEEILELLSPDPNDWISPMSDSLEDPFTPDDQTHTLSEPLQSVPLIRTKAVSEEINKMESSAVVNMHNCHGQTKKAKEVNPSQAKVVPVLQYKPFKKHRLSKTKLIPTQDVLFTPDIVIKKHSSHKKHSDTRRPASSGDSKCSRDKRNEGRREEKASPVETISQAVKQSAQTDTTTSAEPETSRDLKAVQDKNLKSQKAKSPESSTSTNSEASQHQDNKCTKQTVRRLSLYGARDRSSVFIHQCHDRKRSSSAPVYIKIPSASKATDNGKNYSDVPSAKQKIYTQWFSSLVEKPNTPSHKRKRQSKNELKKTIEIQKIVMRERSISRSDNEKSPEAKKFKSTLIEDYFGST